MGELLDGLIGGVGEWKNVQRVVRQALEVVFGEMQVRERERKRNNALEERLRMLEEKVEGLGGSMEALARKLRETPTIGDVDAMVRHSNQVRFAPESPPQRSRDIEQLKSEIKAIHETARVSTSPAPIVSYEDPVSKWTCKASTLATSRHNGIEWTARSHQSGPSSVFDWSPREAHTIFTIPSGIYHITAGLFSQDPVRPSLYINGDESLVSRSCRSYLPSSKTKRGALCLTGHTINDLLWLPANTRITLKLNADVSSPVLKDVILCLRFLK
eukprot:TRINITY_DN30606_c0_g1_i1.p1 TRINITY_DN30606_c0_g1~~TRINITY_DN30606_c0_g1_i1.p1  ORF type:complete len:272 (+),score=35.45 TRINITY_DN30606_c0_g1_i1:35-850(+)